MRTRSTTGLAQLTLAILRAHRISDHDILIYAALDEADDDAARIDARGLRPDITALKRELRRLLIN